MRLDEFDFTLPEELIAQTPLPERSASRLMVVDPVSQSIDHRRFRDLESLLQAGDVLIFNNSKVIPARLFGVKAETGAVIELLLLRPTSTADWIVMARPAKRIKIGSRIQFFSNTDDSTGTEPSARKVIGECVVTEVLEEGLRVVRFAVDGSFEAFLNQVGTVPLPPYIHETLDDPNRYQTVYAKHLGSAAAPTAGLHFTEDMLSRLAGKRVVQAFVTLHVGLGTFRPVQVEKIDEHVMHSEWFEVPAETAEVVKQAKLEGRRVIAVGTTALRTLESAFDLNGDLLRQQGDTNIFIFPGYQFRLVDSLITNFHLPKSTLLMLVSALMGTEFAMQAYREAVEQRYRFFSFGDAMWIQRRVESL